MGDHEKKFSTNLLIVIDFSTAFDLLIMLTPFERTSVIDLFFVILYFSAKRFSPPLSLVVFGKAVNLNTKIRY